MQVQSVGHEDPPADGTATHSSYAWLENPQGERSLVSYSPWGC